MEQEDKGVIQKLEEQKLELWSQLKTETDVSNRRRLMKDIQYVSGELIKAQAELEGGENNGQE